MDEIFYRLFASMPRQGPGTAACTRRACDVVRPLLPAGPRILDVGCGSGTSTLCVAKGLKVDEIVGMDNADIFLKLLQKGAAERGLQDIVHTHNGSMFELPFPDASFDGIWSEGAIYIMGFREGLQQWRRVLRPGGTIAVTEISWLTDSPPQAALDYWSGEEGYPAMQTIDGNIALIEDLGYRMLDHFTLPAEAWTDNYYAHMRRAVDALLAEHPDAPGIKEGCDDLLREITIYDDFGTTFGYEFYIMQS